MDKLDELNTKLESINNRFNAQLIQQIDGNLPKGYIYQLGRPNDILLSAGIPDLPIELSAERLAAKAKQENHVFDLRDVVNLPISIQNPIVIFDSKTQQESVVILTELSSKEIY